MAHPNELPIQNDVMACTIFRSKKWELKSQYQDSSCTNPKIDKTIVNKKNVCCCCTYKMIPCT